MENMFQKLGEILRPENNFQKFLDKQTRLNNALNKVNAKLQYFNEVSQTGANLPEFENWNKWHDLHDRLKDRLQDNYNNFKNWHWEQYRFNTYP